MHARKGWQAIQPQMQYWDLQVSTDRCQILMLNCKKKFLVIFSHVDICFQKKGFEERMMVYVRKSCLSFSDKAGEIPFVTTVPLYLKR